MAILYLNVRERFLVQQLLPSAGAVAMLRQFRSFTESLMLSEDEQKECGFKLNEDGSASLTPGKTGPSTVRKPFSVAETVLHEMVETCKRLDKESRFPDSCLELWDQIVEGKSFEPTKETAVDNS